MPPARRWSCSENEAVGLEAANRCIHRCIWRNPGNHCVSGVSMGIVRQSKGIHTFLENRGILK